MTNNFKKGDKVRRLAHFRNENAWKLNGLICTVHAVFNDQVYLTEDPAVFAWAAAKFELVHEQPEQPAGVPGRKDDSGKLDMTLLDDMPRAIAAVVRVMQWAITDKKPTPYDRGSWQGVHADRYRAAIMRHMRDAAEQATGKSEAARFQRDKETELLHLAHVATSALMALENTLRELEVQQ